MRRILVPLRAIFCVIGATVALGASTESVREARISSEISAYNTPGTIRTVQRALRDRGYYQGYLDGHIGPDTAKAIELFQLNHCLKVSPLVNRELLVWLGLTRHR
jgi:peptidoglycan hydrolase-like protein with peptidoglycan-binding domain